MERHQPVAIAVAPSYSFYSYYVSPMLSWFRILSARFIKGIIEGIIFTPVFELIFSGLRKMHKKQH